MTTSTPTHFKIKTALFKQLLSITAILLLFQVSYSAPVAPVNTMTTGCHPMETTPEMDGIADDYYYSEPIETSYGYESQLPNWDGESDFKCDFQVSWNNNAFYVLVNIQDDVVHNYAWDYEQEWMFDNFEVFLQLDTNTVTTSYGPNTVQLRINRGLDSVQSPGRASRSDWGYFQEETGSGWVAEVAIPWTAVYSEGDTPEDIMDYFGVAIGFDLAGADSDNTDGDETVGNRDFQTFWDLDGEERTGQEDGAWNNTSVFGYITLSERCIGAVNTQNSLPVTCYPNPTNRFIAFPDVERITQISIFDILGNEQLNTEYLPDQQLDISALKDGIYFVVFEDGSRTRFVKQ